MKIGFSFYFFPGFLTSGVLSLSFHLDRSFIAQVDMQDQWSLVMATEKSVFADRCPVNLLAISIDGFECYESKSFDQ